MKLPIALATALVTLSLAVAAAPPAGATSTPPGSPPGWPTPPGIQARAVVLMDAANGQVLYAEHPQLEVQPASLVKIMTFDLALKAMRSGQVTPNTRIRIGLDAWKVALNPNDSRMFLQVGTEVPLKDLLTGLMVSSGDDAAVAIADGLAGSQAAFVREMNREAQALGLVHTAFRNPSGLGAPGQHSTAMDMALLARHVITTYPEYRRYTDVQYFTWNHITQQNFNRLIGVDPAVTGLKSGHLGGPDFHLVTTAHKDGLTLIGVVFGAPTLEASASESESLLDWGFRTFTHVAIRPQGLPHQLPVYQGAAAAVPLRLSPTNPWVTVPRGWQGAVRTSLSLTSEVVAPVAPGQVLGQVTVTVKGTPVALEAVVAARGVPRGGLFSVLFGAVALELHRLMGHLFG